MGAVMSGQIEVGSFLLVESLDRLSRQQPIDAMTQLIELVKYGIVVVTLNDEKVYSTQTFKGTDGTFVLMASLVGMARAFEESDTKGKRVAAAWKNKFNKIKDQHQLTKRVPFWLNSDRTVKPKRVEVVRRIFREYAAGHGTTVITKKLNQDGVAPPDPRAKHWNPSSVKKLLKSTAVVGTLTTGDGQRHDGYYPAVIDDELYFKCQIQIGTGNRGRSRSEQPRPLAGLLRCCCENGGNIVRVARTGRIKKDGTRTLFESVACSKAKIGALGCVYRSVPYEKVVRAIQGTIEEVREKADVAENEEEIRNIDGYMVELSEQLADAYDLFKSIKDRSQKLDARERYETLNREYQDLKAERQRLLAAAGSVGKAVMHKLLMKPEMTNQWLKKVFKSGIMDLHAERLTLTLQNGKTIEVGLDDDPFADAEEAL